MCPNCGTRNTKITSKFRDLIHKVNTLVSFWGGKHYLLCLPNYYRFLIGENGDDTYNQWKAVLEIFEEINKPIIDFNQVIANHYLLFVLMVILMRMDVV